MTLSRFLRDYLYIPLGGSHNGKAQRYLNLMITMLLGGLWHGAGWTFVIWGGLHGFYLMVNHAWRGFKEKLDWGDGGQMAKLGAGVLTFLVVVVGWVFFRVDSYSSALVMLKGMAGMNGQTIPAISNGAFSHYFAMHNRGVLSELTPMAEINLFNAIIVLIVGFIIVWFMPNIQHIFKKYQPTSSEILDQDSVLELDEYTPWIKVSLSFAFGAITTLALIFASANSPFLYYQF